MDAFFVCNPAGRVVAGRPLALWKREDARRYADEFRRIVPTIGPRVILCADLRPITVFPSEVMDELHQLGPELNPYVERSAILVAPENSVNTMQVDRIIRSGHLQERRRFTSRDDLQLWLGEVLTREERAGVAAFLDEGELGPASRRVAARDSALPGLDPGRRPRRPGA